MKYFTMEELGHSDTAVANKIDNRIPANLQQNAIDLTDNVLDKIREKYGKPMHLNCCYRCKALNTLVGGAATSDHLLARAADIANTKELQDLIISMAKSKEIDYDQLIVEKPNAQGLGSWIHISFRRNANRHQNLIFKNDKYVPFSI